MSFDKESILISGYNLPMLMTVLTKRNSGQIDVPELIEECKTSFIYANVLNKDIEDDEF